MKQTVYLITDKYREKFLYRNSSGRWWGVPNNIKDIIHYPTKVVAENQAKWHVDKEEMIVVEFELELKEVARYKTLGLREDEHILIESEEELKEALIMFKSNGVNSWDGGEINIPYYIEDHKYNGEYKTFQITEGRLYTPLSEYSKNTVIPFKNFKKRLK